MNFSSAKSHDFLIRNANGAPIWRWSDGRAFAQSFFSRTLKGGREMAFTSTWNQRIDHKNPAPVGKYTAEAEFNAVGRFTKLGPLTFELVD